MGTLVKEFTIRGNTLKEAWEDYMEEDLYENGHDSYNGTIKNVSMPRIMSKLPNDIDKYSSAAVCIKQPKSNTNKVKSKVENFPCKGTRKWETYYYGIEKFNDFPIKEIEDISQTICIAKARAYTEKRPNCRGIDVHIGKRLIASNTKVAEVTYKSSSNESYGVWKCIAGCPS